MRVITSLREALFTSAKMSFRQVVGVRSKQKPAALAAGRRCDACR
jgi:hypothetical protein